MIPIQLREEFIRYLNNPRELEDDFDLLRWEGIGTHDRTDTTLADMKNQIAALCRTVVILMLNHPNGIERAQRLLR